MLLNTISLNVILLLLISHLIGDILLQTDKMAKNKANNILWLAYHSIVYSVPFIFIGNLLFVFVVVSFHFFIDYITSNIVLYYYDKNIKAVFFTICVDQALHFLCLTFSYALIIGASL